MCRAPAAATRRAVRSAISAGSVVRTRRAKLIAADDVLGVGGGLVAADAQQPLAASLHGAAIRVQLANQRDRRHEHEHVLGSQALGGPDLDQTLAGAARHDHLAAHSATGGPPLDLVQCL